MYLIQLLLPLYAQSGAPIPPARFEAVSHALAERFGGVTAYTRAPASGLWKAHAAAEPMRDDVVVYEVMANVLDRHWWKKTSDALEEAFEQQEIVVRALQMQRLS